MAILTSLQQPDSQSVLMSHGLNSMQYVQDMSYTVLGPSAGPERASCIPYLTASKSSLL